MKKNKIIMTIIVGLMCLVLFTVMFMQFKTIEETDITAIENMRESELRTAISEWKTKYEETNTKLEETQKSIMNYCILGYQARGIDLEPLTLLFMGKYETMVREAAIAGIILPTPDQEDQMGTQE